MSKIISVVLGGGKGTRLYPLTKDRSKPAVPFGGKFRIVDIPISNSINSDIKKIFILTQFNSHSLHKHLTHTYQFDSYTEGFVQILAAEQTFNSDSWFMGTADAVRQQFAHIMDENPEYVLILSGDQLYRLNFQKMIDDHIKSKAEISIAATPVSKEATPAFGILQMNEKGALTNFLEKPPLGNDISDYIIPSERHPDKKKESQGLNYLASMGIYLFNADILKKCLKCDSTDFGKEIIPDAIREHKVQGYIFSGFWEDIGTIKSFYDTNIELASLTPPFNFYDTAMPIYTHRRDLPASKFNYCHIEQSLTADGCIVTASSVKNSLIGIRSIIESGTELEGVVCMGADFYETPEARAKNLELGRPHVGIAKNCKIKTTIIDKNARIGENCSIGVEDKKREEGDFNNYYIKDGIIIIPKNAVIPPGTTI